MKSKADIQDKEKAFEIENAKAEALVEKEKNRLELTMKEQKQLLKHRNKVSE